MNENTPLSAEDEGRLDDFYRAMEKESSRFVGYPSNGCIAAPAVVQTPVVGTRPLSCKR